jgi:hypothetical protein
MGGCWDGAGLCFMNLTNPMRSENVYNQDQVTSSKSPRVDLVDCKFATEYVANVA